MSNSTPLPSSFDGDTDFYEENRWQKLTRRLKEEPLIPLGCILTSLALVGASRSIRAGDHNRTQRMFRARIYAQGFTLLAMVAGSMYWDSDRKKRKEFEGVLAETKAKEKNEAWIRELEARDEEEKEMRRARDERRRRAEGRPAPKAVVTDAPAEEGEKPKGGVMEQMSGLVWGKK
ncbi:Bcrcf1 [Botrytis cinerea B05.10]|uniref:Respiratory supercomplex factor 1, mitochondrial n=3 Tax=Botryotinia fuckeliana TaxID=40559 RepID=RCF1_BOTFB|nr:Bcrcf1 [Botrytis cinerea B05.10]A6SSX6.1 RecName: Full=Respiratory supercomplex factor 1, mitochondrial [Botrytis cinerea B05.10]ATZ45200.1 Bcrcf1 [Botrytis cinerea B05.10]EMR81155.1 putative hypoxia induced family protein [Botrytis cinerea BcDW1]CCD51124.1 similar to mitochondrial hypoxia responsive domain protein [Botrytis cinerea T4]